METSAVDRDQLWQLVRGQLAAEQTAALCSLVSSDPAVARAYVEVKLEHELQLRRECATAKNGPVCETPPPVVSPTVTPAETPANAFAPPVAVSAPSFSIAHAILYFAIAAVVGFGLMGLIVNLWSRI